MTCAVCKKDMCYCCRKDVSLEGYRHFDMESEGKTTRCPLWEDSMERHKRDLEEAKQKMGATAPGRTKAEEQDEATRRRLFRERQSANFMDLEGVVDHPDEEAHLYIPPEQEMHRWDVHNAILAERRRREEHVRETRNQQQELDLVHRFEALTQREDRLQILGFGLVASVKPRYGEKKAFRAPIRTDQQPPLPSKAQSTLPPPPPRMRPKSHSHEKGRPPPAPQPCPTSPAKGKAKSSPPTTTPQPNVVEGSSSPKQPSSPNPSRSRKKHNGPLIQAANQATLSQRPLKQQEPVLHL